MYLIQGASCCGYGTDGAKSEGVYDCLIIPGAEKAGDYAKLAGAAQCGGAKGLVEASDGAAATVCSK